MIEELPEERAIRIPRARVRPMAGQPREYFDQDELARLSESIKEFGQVVSVMVSPVVDDDPRHDYQIIDGQRRWHALEMAGIRTIKCVVKRGLGEDECYDQSVIANLCRQANHPLEIAVACDRMRRRMTVSQVAKCVGHKEPWVYQHLSLLRLIPEIQEGMHPRVPKERRIPLSVGAMLARLDPGKQREALDKIRSEERGGRGLMRATKRVLEGMPPPTDRPRRGPKPSDRYRNLTRLLRRVADDLKGHSPDQLRQLVGRRPDDEAATLRLLLDRIESGVEAIREALQPPGRR